MTVIFRTQKVSGNAVYFDFVTLDPAGGGGDIAAKKNTSFLHWIINYG